MERGDLLKATFLGAAGTIISPALESEVSPAISNGKPNIVFRKNRFQADRDLRSRYTNCSRRCAGMFVSGWPTTEMRSPNNFERRLYDDPHPNAH